MVFISSPTLNRGKVKLSVSVSSDTPYSRASLRVNVCLYKGSLSSNGE